MRLIDKNTVENLVIILSAVFWFQVLPLLPFVGQYMDKPTVLLVIGGVMIIYFKKILDAFTFVDREKLKSALFVFISFLMFNAIPKFEPMKQLFVQYSWMIALLVVIAIFNKDKIANVIGG